mmetsp:Transcript_25678/g.83237  ORF Transcript_25678/g.83237 Transcript_25678/m.83237 type:complete len:258 (-) Transcript_25678:406-1179(-)
MKKHCLPLLSSWVMTCAYEQTQSKIVACGGLDNLCSIFALIPHVSRPSCELAGHDGYLSCCRFIDECKILTASGDGTCCLWDIERRQAAMTFTGHTSDVMSIDLAPSCNTFVTGSCDATAKLWDWRMPAVPAITFQGHDSDINSVSFCPSGEAFVTGSDDSTCHFFDTRCLLCINKFKSERTICGITSVCSSASGRLLFCGMDNFNCYCWDMCKDGMTCSPLWALTGHENRVSCLDVCRSGECVCTGSWDTLIKSWA